MNYLALAAGIFFALVALRAFLMIGSVFIGRKRWVVRYGFLVNATVTSITAPLAVWLFGMVA